MALVAAFVYQAVVSWAAVHEGEGVPDGAYMPPVWWHQSSNPRTLP